MKKVCRNCHGCKRFQAMTYTATTPGCLQITRTEGVTPFQVIRVDYAGPLRYRISRQREGKAYVLLYACSLTRGVYPDLLPSLETRMLGELEEVHWEVRETRTNLFRQWQNICWCSNVGQGSDERRVTPQLPVSQPDQVAV